MSLEGSIEEGENPIEKFGDRWRLCSISEYEEGNGVIVHVEPRFSILSRADNLSRRKEQLIASNIDQVIITVSVVQPALKISLIDRYIIAAKKGKMEPIIAITKVDLLNDEAIDPVYGK